MTWLQTWLVNRPVKRQKVNANLIRELSTLTPKLPIISTRDYAQSSCAMLITLSFEENASLPAALPHWTFQKNSCSRAEKFLWEKHSRFFVFVPFLGHFEDLESLLLTRDFRLVSKKSTLSINLRFASENESNVPCSLVCILFLHTLSTLLTCISRCSS